MSAARTILHVDMDAFYASVEQRDDASLRGEPVIVGGPFRRGVVSAASYEARPFGVRSAMSMSEAMRRCPHAKVVAPRHEHYSAVSRQVFAIFRRFTPMVEGISLDEAFLDVTASRSLYGDGESIARRIKDAISSELELKASAGVAPSKFVAKIASDLRKPDALVVVRSEEVRDFLAPLPIERMWGIGPKSAPRAHSAGFHTLGDLARADAARLERVFGKWGPEMAQLARGDDPREVEPEREAKSVGAEETFDEDLRDPTAIATRLLSQSSRVAQRLHLAGLAGRGVTVKLKYADFTVKTRSLQLPEAVSDTGSIYKAARALLARFEPNGRGVRLTGVSVSALATLEDARTLFPDPAASRGRKLEAAMAALRDRGAGITRAALLGEDDERG
ncbi:MAG: DNA polymerase IV [Myxococcota bacterium]|nr:DNA polymerase IV [Myxococcota bacterium]